MTPPQWRDWIQLPRLHYVLHLALISSYALARRYFTQHGHTEYSRIITTPEQLFAFEKQAGGMMAAVLAIQVKSLTACGGSKCLTARFLPMQQPRCTRCRTTTDQLLSYSAAPTR